VRHLIKPTPGYGVAYLDFEQQEFGIAAALSQDPNMLAAYRSGDSYLAFAKQAKAVPEWATKDSHEPIRNLYKTGSLSAQYGISAHSLAVALGQPLCVAHLLLERHKRFYRQF
jgi:DNA polymerase I-like protein with 3'-5' exonuclease and polymerase domains